MIVCSEDILVYLLYIKHIKITFLKPIGFEPIYQKLEVFLLVLPLN